MLNAFVTCCFRNIADREWYTRILWFCRSVRSVFSGVIEFSIKAVQPG